MNRIFLKAEMKMEKLIINIRKKGNTAVVLPILILSVAIATISYLYWRLQNLEHRQISITRQLKETQIPEAKTKEVTSSVDEKVNWKMYKNIIYGYEFQYPSDWEIWSVDRSIDNPSLTPVPDPATGKNLVMGYLKRGRGLELKRMQLDVTTLDNLKNLNLQEYFIDQKWGKEYIKLMENSLVNNMEAVNLKFSGAPSGYFINVGKHIINLRFSYDETDEKFEIPPPQIFDQILSTFKTL